MISTSSNNSNSNGDCDTNKNKSTNDIDDWTQDLIKYFDFKYSKYLTVLLVTLFIFYHGYLNSFYGRNSCNRLLDEGHILGNNEWQPFGCMIHKYDKNDIETCFKYVKYYNGKNRFIFIGDFRMKQVYQSFIKHIDKFSKSKQSILNENMNYTNKNLNLDAQFIWKPIIDDSLISLIESHLQPNVLKPSFIVMGMGTAYIKPNTTKESLEWFKRNLSALVENIKSINYDTKYPVLNKLNEPTQFSTSSKSSYNNNAASQSFFPSIYWMLQDPIDEYKYSFNKSIANQITNKQIDLYNRAAISLLHYSHVNIWSSSRLVSQGYNKDSPDGLHIGPFALEIDSQILFNLHCNNRMNFADASCCSQPESVSLIQQVIFSFFFICFAVVGFLLTYKNSCKKFSKFKLNISGSEISLAASCKSAASSIGAFTVLTAMSKLALIMFYFFACDRANYFMKENKHFTLLTFSIPLIYISVLGLFFHDSSSGSKAMNRQQTEEIKGFMQLVILIYKMSDGQNSTPLYFVIRLFTSGYLFLSGYGHFMYYWKTSNYGITRFFEVLFRLNFLPIMLCFSMNRMYQFYEFIPMITFWYICSYILMVVYPRVSAKSAKDNPQHYFYMIIKLCLFGGLITTLNMSEILFEKIFMARPWKFLFVNYDDLVNGWRSRWSLDCYSFLFGMCFALLICILKRCNYLENDYDYESGEWRRELRNMPFCFKFILVVLSLVGLISYATFAGMCQVRESCNEYTPYISIIPILSYLILRNTVDCLRDKCSYLFSWFGRISLELFVCSSHIWLAADSNGILVLLPGYPVLNILITTFIFICISHELNSITKLLSSYFVPNNWRICLRNFISFIILLMPIAIKNGYI